MQRSIISQVIKTCYKYPNSTAVKVSGESLTYYDLLKRARVVSTAILDLINNNGLPKVIGIYSNKSIDSYIAIFSTMLSGCTFVPLNPSFPIHRTKKMIEISNSQVVLMESSNSEKILQIIHEIDKKIYLIDMNEKSKNLSKNSINTISCSYSQMIGKSKVEDMSQIAYILFTSGSTGEPKAVPISHDNIYSFINYNHNLYKFSVNDRFSNTFDHTFDLSLFDIFMAWWCGGCIYPLHKLELLYPLEFIVKNQLTVWFSVPSIISILMKHNSRLPKVESLKLSLFCGEPLTSKQVVFWKKCAPKTLIENLYGPTELTVACSRYHINIDKVNFEKNYTISIGKIYPHLRAIMVNNNNQIDSHEGELCVSGKQMFTGYLNHDNNDTFLTQNHDEQIRYYRTGDIVRKDNHGKYIYIGRKDSQIKVGGFRVELGEVERAAEEHSGVNQAIAFGGPLDSFTCSYIILVILKNTLTVDYDSIELQLKNKLPTYMVPKKTFFFGRFPSNSNGKVDKKKLKKRIIALDRELKTYEETHVVEY